MSAPESSRRTQKPSCYDCVHRGEVAGSAHSCCNHPDALAGGEASPFRGLLAILAGARHIAVPLPAAAEKMGVTGKAYGISNGWFNWPENFDPVWLVSCDAFEAAAEARHE